VKRLEVTNLSADAIAAIRAEQCVHNHWFDVDHPTPRCYASIDVHHALSLDIPVDELLASATERQIDAELTVRVPDLTWLAVHLIFKVYWEGVHNYGKGLYEYADIARLLPRVDPDTFARALQVLGQYRLRAAAYYVLRRLPLLGIDLPKCVEAFLDAARTAAPGEHPLEANDFGDVWPKLFGRR